MASSAIASSTDSTNRDFTYYVFIEKDPERVDELQKLEQEYAETRKILIRQSDCNRYLLDRLVENPKINWTEWRAVVFLDPFGMQVPWSTLVALGQTKAIEVFLNFPVGMAIQRLLLRSGGFTEKRRGSSTPTLARRIGTMCCIG